MVGLCKKNNVKSRFRKLFNKNKIKVYLYMRFFKVLKIATFIIFLVLLVCLVCLVHQVYSFYSVFIVYLVYLFQQCHYSFQCISLQYFKFIRPSVFPGRLGKTIFFANSENLGIRLWRKKCANYDEFEIAAILRKSNI